MGMPPPHLATPGRANPRGIPYLYVATDIHTAILEIRPSTNEFVTIGKFKSIHNLSILDLSNQKAFDPYSCGNELGSILQITPFLYMLGKELSKPVDPKQKDLHYIPTQYLCEYIKHSGYDGVAYKSNVGTGINIAIFDSKKVKCTRTTLYALEAKENVIKNA